MKKKNNNKILFIVIVSLFMSAALLYAHPHIYIDNRVCFVFDAEGLIGMKLAWEFNEMYSSILMQDFDKNENGEFDSKELKVIEEDAFSNLRDYDYFSHITIDGKEFEVKKVKDFYASIIGGEIVEYSFFIPCEVIAGTDYRTVVLSVYDETYYIDIKNTKDEPVKVENIADDSYSYKIIDNPEKPYYYGQIIPEEIVFKFRK